MADRHTTVFGDQIDVTALGGGLQKDVDDNLEVYVDDATLELSVDSGSEGQVRVKDEGITKAKLASSSVDSDKLDTTNSPTDGYIPAYDLATGKFTWVSNEVANVVKEADVIVNEIPSGTIDSLNVTFTLANTPVTGTVAVYLNGLLQAPGDGLDYTISGTTITFTKAPRTNSDLYVSYIIDN